MYQQFHQLRVGMSMLVTSTVYANIKYGISPQQTWVMRWWFLLKFCYINCAS